MTSLSERPRDRSTGSTSDPSPLAPDERADDPSDAGSRAPDDVLAASAWPGVRLVLSALALLFAVHACLEPLLADGSRLALAVLADLLALATLAGVIFLIRPSADGDRAGTQAVLPGGPDLGGPDLGPDRRALGVLLALIVVGLLAGARVAATGLPWTGVDAAVCLVAAATLVRGRRLAAVAVVTLVSSGAAVALDLARATSTSAVSDLASSTILYLGAELLVSVVVAFAVSEHVRAAFAAGGQERRRAEALTVLDSLTGLCNRQGLEMIAGPMLENARRSGQAVHCVYLDVDELRAVNDAVGLTGGDRVLRSVAQALFASVRTTDVAARWSGDEFVVVGPGTGSSPLELERRVRAQLAEAPAVPVEVWGGRVSVGSATLVPWDDGDLASLLHRADQDMTLRRSLRRQGRERAADTPGGQPKA